MAFFLFYNRRNFFIPCRGVLVGITVIANEQFLKSLILAILINNSLCMHVHCACMCMAHKCVCVFACACTCMHADMHMYIAYVHVCLCAAYTHIYFYGTMMILDSQVTMYTSIPVVILYIRTVGATRLFVICATFTCQNMVIILQVLQLLHGTIWQYPVKRSTCT